MALAKYYRFWAVNNTGVTSTYASGARLNLRILPWKYVDGVKTYYDVITDDLGFTTGEIADGVSSEGDVQDNRTNLYQGAKCYFEHVANAAASGSYDLYMEESDDNANWPSDNDDFDDEVDGIHVISVIQGQAGTRGKNFSI
jgi:hypothetical protein